MDTSIGNRFQYPAQRFFCRFSKNYIPGMNDQIWFFHIQHLDYIFQCPLRFWVSCDIMCIGYLQYFNFPSLLNDSFVSGDWSFTGFISEDKTPAAELVVIIPAIPARAESFINVLRLIFLFILFYYSFKIITIARYNKKELSKKSYFATKTQNKENTKYNLH